MNKTLPNRKSNRLTNFNYSNNGLYFITICTHNKNCYFGKIENSLMELNEMGFIVQQTWQNLINHFKYIELDTYTVMPNHFHALVLIKNDHFSLPNRSLIIKETNSLATVITYFKSEVSKKIKKCIGQSDIWQKGYYDHIIRNEIDLQNTRNYIVYNATKWNEDEYHTKHL